MKKTLQQKEGFTLLITIIGLALMTTLGFAILTSTTNNFKATDTDSKNQSAYYIAEAGINYSIDSIDTLVKNTKASTSTQFFSSIKNSVEKLPKTITFDKNFNTIPYAKIQITVSDVDNSTKDYHIKSVGLIGDNQRTVSSIISVKWETTEIPTEGKAETSVTNTNSFQFKGPNLSAEGETIVLSQKNLEQLDGGSKVDAKNIYFEKITDATVKGSILGNTNRKNNIYFDGNIKQVQGNMDIYGNVYVNGSMNLNGSAKIKGNLYVRGDLNINGQAKVEGNTFVGGYLTIASANLDGNVEVYNGMSASWGAKIGGTLRVEGNSKFEGSNVEKKAFINGSLTITGSPKFNNGVTHTQTVIEEGYVEDKKRENYNKVSSIESIDKVLFDFKVPRPCKISLREPQWYVSKGYTIFDDSEKTDIESNKKWVVNKYYQLAYKYLEKVILISKGPIKINSDKNVTGVYISLDGDVEFNNSTNFDGVMMSNGKLNFSNGGAKVKLQSLETYFKGVTDDYPVKINCDDNKLPDLEGGSLPGNGNGQVSSNTVVNIKKPIKEE